MLCNECPKRDSCKSLCKEAEEYTNQDYRFEKETPLSELDLDEDFLPTGEQVWNTNGIGYWDLQELKDKYNLTDRQFDILYMYFIDGMSQTDIAKELGITKQAISKIILKLGCQIPNK